MMKIIELAQKIDQTNLNPALGYSDIKKFLIQSKELQFKSVAILPIYTSIAANLLKDSLTKVCVAISYPFGNIPYQLKVKEVNHAIDEGAEEIDYVINVLELKSGNYQTVLDEAKAIVSAAEGRITKAIIEIWSLNEDEIKAACEIICEAKVAFVKSSTAFKGYKAMRAGSVDDAKILKKYVRDRAQIKIAGGINSLSLAMDLLSKGVGRIGTSSGKKIMEEFLKSSVDN